MNIFALARFVDLPDPRPYRPRPLPSDSTSRMLLLFHRVARVVCGDMFAEFHLGARLRA